jgi:hypothetical protein
MTATRFCRIGVECPNNENAIYTPAKKKIMLSNLPAALKIQDEVDFLCKLTEASEFQLQSEFRILC